MSGESALRRRSELLSVGLGRVLGAALALAGFFVLTRQLPPEEYALVALLMGFSSFAGLVLLNPAGQWANRHIHEWHDQRALHARLQELLRLVLGAALVVGSLSAGWYLLTSATDLIEAVAVGAIVAGLVYFTTAALAFSSALNALGHRREAVVWQLATNGLGLLLAVLLVQLDATATLWLAGLAMGAALAWVGAGTALRHVVSRDDTQEEGNHRPKPFFGDGAFKHFALGLTMVTTLMWLEGNGYRFILERGWSARDLGLFLMALSVPAQLTAVLESVVMQFAYPYFYRSLAGLDDKEKLAGRTSAMTGALLPLYWIWGGLLFLMAPQFLYLIAGIEYHGAAEWMAFGVMLEVARLTGNACQLVAQATKDFRPMVAPFALGAAGSTLTSLLAVVFGGTVTAVGAGMVAVATIKALYIVLRARRMLAVRIPAARSGAAGLVLVAGLAAQSLLAENHGALASISMLMVAGAIFLALAYLHLRTASDFNALLQQKLG